MIDKKSDFIEQLFDTISCDPTMPAELKIQLLRLQLPMHKLCQSDPYFISNEKHPARRTIFIIKRLSIYAKSDTSLVDKITIILSDLLKSSPTAANFGNTNLRLEILNKNLKSTHNAQLDKEIAIQKNIKKSFNHKIRLCLQGHEIPDACKYLVLKLWPNALFYLYKKHGDQNKQWTDAIDLYCKLLNSIQPVSNIDQYSHLKDQFMTIARSNNKTLLMYHQQTKVEPAIKDLINYYNNMLGKNTKSRTSSILTQEQTALSVHEKISALPSNIKPGIWCEIYIDDITPSRRLRLSVINFQTAMLIFVNRKGVKMIEKDAGEFTEELKRGLSKAYKHEDLFKKPTDKKKNKKIS